jgi:hypothetical protein
MSDGLPVLELPAFAPEEETSVIAAFAAIPVLVLGQAWRDRAQPELKSGRVQVGWRENALWALAELEDEEIFNLADGHNQATWELGDAFEVFAQKRGEPGYTEVHVTPENYRLHLRFPDTETIGQVRSGKDSHAAYFADAAALFSRTWVHRAENCWRALLKLPFPIVPGEEWRLSFCRYDATQGAKPVTSSTSPHTVADFHRPSEWRRFLVK